MGTRHAALVISRPLLLRPFTSVSTGEQNSKTPEFEYLIPREAEAEFIRLREATWPSVRFVYIFLSQERVAQIVEDTLESFLLKHITGGVDGNLLLLVVRVEPNGKQSVVFGRLAKEAADSGLEPQFDPVNDVETSSVEPETQDDELTGAYAVASPILLPLDAIKKLEERRPAGVPVFGTGMGLGVDGPLDGATPASARWVFPVVDPLLIAENLTRKYSEACDNFLAASQQFERPPARTEDEAAARTRGEVQRLKKVVADNLVALKQAAGDISSVFEGTLEPGFPERFIDEHDAFLKALAFERERAAYHLVAWLESEVFAMADDWWPRNDANPAADYDLYVRTPLGAIPRLIESSCGVAYLCDLLHRREQGSSPVPSGALHVVSEYVLRDANSSKDQRIIAIKEATRVFRSWSAFLGASLAVQQRIVKGPNPNTTFAEDLERFVKRLSFVFQERFLDVEHTPVPIDLTPPRGIKKSVVTIPGKSLVIPPAMLETIKKLKLSTDHVTRVIAILNFGLAYTALRNTLAEQGDARAKHMAMSDLTGASLGIVSQGVTLPAVVRFRDRFAGKINMGGALLGNRAAGTLGLLGAIAALTSASLAATEEFERGDWDKAMAHMTEGFGAVLVGAGFAVILASGTTGPFALWTIGIGTAISAAGFVWSVFAADTELEQMLKFSAFGRQKGQPATKPPGWSQCKTSFAEWAPETVEGLTRQLRAFQQIFYSFQASGAAPTAPGPLASDGILRLIPSTLREKCTFHIKYEATYVSTHAASKTKPVLRKGEATVQIFTGRASFEDGGKHYEEANAVTIHNVDGRDSIDVRFRLRTQLTDDLGLPMELETLTCFVQLHVPDAAADEASPGETTLIVPTTNGGPKALPVRPVRERKVSEAEEFSVKII